MKIVTKVLCLILAIALCGGAYVSTAEAASKKIVKISKTQYGLTKEEFKNGNLIFHYRVSKNGEKLEKIAASFHSTAEEIARENKLKKNQPLKKGQSLTITLKGVVITQAVVNGALDPHTLEVKIGKRVEALQSYIIDPQIFEIGEKVEITYVKNKNLLIKIYVK